MQFVVPYDPRQPFPFYQETDGSTGGMETWERAEILQDLSRGLISPEEAALRVNQLENRD